MYQKVAEMAQYAKANSQKAVRTSIFLLGATVLSGLGVSTMLNKEAEAQGSERRNVVLFVADDMGYADMGAYGSEIDTPVMDSLAANGVMFNNFHTGPNCSPSRSMLLTGVDNHRAGLGQMIEKLSSNQEGKPGYEGVINESVVILPEVLQDAGYNTHMIGKWHLGGAEEGHGLPPYEQGFKRTYGLLEGGGDHYSNRAFAPGVHPSQFYYDGEFVDLPSDFYATKDFTDAMIDFVEDDRSNGNPFFAFFAYTAPHTPLQVPDEDLIRKYEPIYAKGWDVIREERFKRQQELGLIPDYIELPPRWAEVEPWDSLSPEAQKIEAKKMAIYAAMIEYLDREMGRYMDYLRTIGEYDNTIFIFLSDNGGDGHDRASTPAYQKWFQEVGIDNSYENMGKPISFLTRGINWAQVSVTPHWGQKATQAEGGLRGPAMIYAPGLIEPGKVTNAFTSVLDIAPTVLDYVGVSHPGDTYKGKPIHEMNGRSMRPILEGTADYIYGPHEPIGFEVGGDVNDALYMGDWKLLRLAPSEEAWGDGTWKLYNLAIDPRELHDMSDLYPQLCDQMVEYYKTYLEEMGYVPAKPPVGSIEEIRSCSSN